MADMKIEKIEDLASYLGTEVRLLKKDVYKYTECGAWIDWDSREVRVGSIVEGSDAEVGPRHLEFPFDSDDYENVIRDVETEADMLWHMWNDEEEEE